MATLNETIINGKLNVTGTTVCYTCKVGDYSLVPLGSSSTIASNTASTNLVSAAQVVAYITALRS